MSVKLNMQFINTRAAALDMNLRELAKASGIGEATIYRFNSGQGFNAESLEKLANGLQCNPIDLILVEGEYPAPLMVASFAGSGHAPETEAQPV
jgi:DNA-binding Xre family transcriptional regulator